MDYLCGMIFLALVLPGLAAAVIAATKTAQDNIKKKQNPELWYREKQIEIAHKQLEEAAKQREHDRTKTNIGIGSTFGQIILKSFLK